MKKRFALVVLLAVLVIGFIAFKAFRRPGPGGPSPDEMVNLLLEYDQNGDGQLRTEEVPERMQGLFARGDANHDDVLSKEELRRLAEADAAAAPRKGRDQQY